MEKEPILKSVKLALGGGLVSCLDSAFDDQLLMCINSTFTILNQLGVGPKELFVAKYDTCWDEFLVDDSTNLELVKTYMYLRVRLMFDPPSSSFILDSFQRQINEYEWRLNVFVDNELPECCGRKHERCCVPLSESDIEESR